MAGILRGEVYWADLNPVRGSEQAGFPLTLELETTKMPKKVWVKIGQIRTLSTERIGRRIAAIEREELDRVVEGLNELIG